MITQTREEIARLQDQIRGLKEENRRLVARVADTEAERDDAREEATIWRRGWEEADNAIRRLTGCEESPLYGRTVRVVMPDERPLPVPIALHREPWTRGRVPFEGLRRAVDVALAVFPFVSLALALAVFYGLLLRDQLPIQLLEGG